MKGTGEKFLRVELHVHTITSFDSLVPINKLLNRCKKLGIDRVAITDHNAIDAALEAKVIAPELVIVGEEIETSEGELIGYFVSERVPPGLDPIETIERLRAQGAVISVPHPFDVVRSKTWRKKIWIRLHRWLMRIEIFNARCTCQTPNYQGSSLCQAA